jgi:hypothetical protein
MYIDAIDALTYILPKIFIILLFVLSNWQYRNIHYMGRQIGAGNINNKIKYK